MGYSRIHKKIKTSHIKLKRANQYQEPIVQGKHKILKWAFTNSQKIKPSRVNLKRVAENTCKFGYGSRKWRRPRKHDISSNVVIIISSRVKNVEQSAVLFRKLGVERSSKRFVFGENLFFHSNNLVNCFVPFVWVFLELCYVQASHLVFSAVQWRWLCLNVILGVNLYCENKN